MKSISEIAKKSYMSLKDLVTLEELLLGTGYMTPETARREIEWFTVELGIDSYYFKTTGIEEIAKHLIAISASELVSRYGGEGVGIQLMNERADRAIYIVEDVSSKTEEIEKRIDRKYTLYRLESYRTKKKTGNHYLRFYVVTKPSFRNQSGSKKEVSFEDVASQEFLERSSPETIERYRKAWESMNNRESPYIAFSDKPETNETRVMVGIHSGENRDFLTNFSHLLYKYNIYSNRKYREPFRDNKRIYTFYFDKLDKAFLENFVRDLNAVVMLPEHPLTDLFYREVFSAQETMYAVSAATFTHQFLTVLTTEYKVLKNALKDQPEAKGILDTIKMRLVKDTFSETRIAQAVFTHPEIVALLYQHFKSRLAPEALLKASSRSDTEKSIKKLEEDIKHKIEQDVSSNKNKTILQYFKMFNDLISKTNFFMRDKTCMAYKLDPEFLDPIDFPEKPFAIFFFAGREFIGFHVRFRDIARGGIRIVRSRSLTSYENNLDTIFIENYNLASTQQKKNKDIPEGGSKGTILLHLQNQDEAERAFKSYIDGMMDLIIPNEEVKDLYGKKEIIFIGPDEGTAELMNWACLYAKRRNYPFWKAFSTGKAPELGGVPHDLYGMTTVGIHEYVLGVLEKLNLGETKITKIQTGGPDGDLGSNEILISKDKTIAVIDGSGVLYDPEGINRDELIRCARKRVMVEQFDRSKLSPRGFFVSINDRKVKLPDGTVVHNGEEFRNRFHLHPLAKADLFVPCGGRPAAININNWQQLFDKNEEPKFKIIVEGANLFITEDARLRLEENGIIVLKDASTNKGGVTSSSLEVLASLALNDDEFDIHMRVTNGKIPEFRKTYVNEIISRIKRNARLEFELMWKEHSEKNIPFTILSNMISKKINEITDSVHKSNLGQERGFVKKVVERYVPESLLRLIGIENLMKRVPENYLKAIVSTQIATEFVYQYGIDGDEVDFYNFIDQLKSQ